MVLRRISGALVALAMLGPAVALAGSPVATVTTDHGCYLVGQKVLVFGSHFAPSRDFDLAVDGVDFGQSTTNSSGGFIAQIGPGGLNAGIVQGVDTLDATDGTSSADATITVTRPTGARFLATSGNPLTLRSQFQVWGFGMDGVARTVYLHYVAPGGRVRDTVRLGTSSGQCGYLLTGRRRVFPFAPTRGTWTFQIDARRTYARRPRTPVARIRVTIG